MSRRDAGRRRRIAVVTGTRAEYGLLTTVMRAIKTDPRLSLQLVVTGMHLLRDFGHTVDQVVRDGWRIDARVPMQTGSDDALDQAEGLGRGVAGIARFLDKARTDIVVVLGDRIEAMAGALAAVTTGRILAHIHGGEVAPGDFDDPLRHAITKLAHVHFAATRQAARRIIRLGETHARVHVVGAVGLDRLREILEHGKRPPKRLGQALVVYHAHGRPPAVEARAMSAVLRAVTSLGLRRLVVYPNTDRGHRGVIAAIEEHQRACTADQVQVWRSLPRDDYLRAMIGVDVLVGNSSSGIIEAPLAGTPSVNVGPRQAGRESGGTSVLHVDESCDAIRRGVLAALRKRSRPGRPTVYGDGRAGERIARLLACVPLPRDFARKVSTY